MVGLHTSACALLCALGSSPVEVDSAGRITAGRLRLTTVGLGREGALVCAGGLASPVDRAVEIDRHLAVERLEPEVGGLEQSWRFERPPPGHGDAIVLLAFEGPVEELEERYGEATWIDARGTRTPIRRSVADGRLSLRIPAALLDSSAYPAVLDPLVSGELELEPPTWRSRASQPAVAYGGGRYLVAWTDSPGPSSSPRIIGTLLSEDGAVQIPGFLLSRSARACTSPAVAFDGQRFLVLWSRGSADAGDLELSFVWPGGSPGRAPRVLTTHGNAGAGSLASGPGSHLVAYLGRDGGVFALPLSAVQLAPSGPEIELESAPYRPGTPRVATASQLGRTYFQVVWTNQEVFGLTLRQVELDGGVTDFVRRPNGGQWSPAVAGFDGGSVVVWHEQPLDGGSAESLEAFEVIHPDGHGAAFPISLNLGTPSPNPTIATRGDDLVIAWSTARSGTPAVYGRYVSREGRPTSPELELAVGTDDHAAPSVACGASGGCLLAAQYGVSPGGELHAIALSPDGGAPSSPGPLVSSVPGAQRRPAVAFDGTGYLTVWEDEGAGDPLLRARRFSPAGAPTEPGRPLSLSDAHTRPEVGCGGRGCLVMWRLLQNGQAATVAALLQPDLSAGATLLRVGDSAGEAHRAIASGRDWHLVVWAELELGQATVWGSLVGPDGARAPFAIGGPLSLTAPPQVAAAFAQGGYVVAWTEDGRLVTRWLSSDGTTLTPPVEVLPADARAAEPEIAPGGDGFLLVWMDAATGAAAVRAARLALDGTPLDVPGALGGSLIDGASPTAVFDGRRFVVAWLATRSGPMNVISGTAVEPTGPIAASDPFTIDCGSSGCFHPRLASAGDGSSLLAYVREDSRGFEVARMRIIGEAGPPACAELEVAARVSDLSAALGSTVSLEIELVSARELQAFVRLGATGLRLAAPQSDGGPLPAASEPDGLRAGPVTLAAGVPARLVVPARIEAMVAEVTVTAEPTDASCQAAGGTIALSPGRPRTKVGCGCASGASPAGALALLLLLRIGRRSYGGGSKPPLGTGR